MRREGKERVWEEWGGKGWREKRKYIDNNNQENKTQKHQ